MFLKDYVTGQSNKNTTHQCWATFQIHLLHHICILLINAETSYCSKIAQYKYSS